MQIVTGDRLVLTLSARWEGQAKPESRPRIPARLHFDPWEPVLTVFDRRRSPGTGSSERELVVVEKRSMQLPCERRDDNETSSIK
jgi:hypothetical protein